MEESFTILTLLPSTLLHKLPREILGMSDDDAINSSLFQNDDYSYDDDVDDDDWVDDDADDVISDHSVDLKNHTILKEQDIRNLQEIDISEISTVLQILNEAACLLLLHYNWSVTKVHEAWFSDEQKVRNTVGILVMDTPLFSSFKVSFSKFNCGICFDEYDDFEFLHCVGCGHFFCDSCWRGYINTSVNDGPGCLMLKCPQPKCNVAIGRDMVEKFASDENKLKYYGFLCRSYVENSRKIKWCPGPGCDSAVKIVVGSGSYDVICDCSCGFCWNCVEEIHRPVDCETVEKWITKNNVGAANTNWILVNSKPCPKCKRPIEKNQGCNHMTCNPACKFQFCWICLHDWKHHNAGSCNSYRVANKDSESENTKKNIRKYLEKYTHYYERWAANNSSRRKALADLNEMKNVHVKKLSEVQCQTESELKFVLEAWEQIVECRRVLKWTYAYGFYLSEQDSKMKLEFLEHLQGEAESGLERLHHCAEKELMTHLKSDKAPDDYNDIQTNDFNGFRKKLTGLTNTTRNFFENLVRALENGLSDVNVEIKAAQGSCRKRSKPSLSKCY